MVAVPSVEEVMRLSAGGRTRADAEEFAVSFAQLQVDATRKRDQQALVDRLASSEMDPDMRWFVLGDYQAQRNMGTRRRFDPSGDAWMRSEPIGGAGDGLDRVNVEVIAVLTGFPGADPFVGWSRARVDVVWEGQAWKVIHYALSSFGPFDVEGKRMAGHLKGPGWRRLQPSRG
jgi:hypothetical protein